ncbi:glycosyltransferase [Antarcticibacterium sp. 1MA-6-2]|uniref:glycosyltransferase n=1 Tax=Antarcticibacterium sp. 1MA-6-2 TaxID=2908210 RepID=UPI002882EB1E|nr:glycosyltransferase [Antarcticibacterium sp. 1MA-6-2]
MLQIIQKCPHRGKCLVSVIICAKNEAENLKKLVPSVLNQKYFDFEVILINDASTDETLDLMEQFQEKDPRIKIVNVQNNEAFWGKKKYALTLGIKKSKNPYLLFTDADCLPESDLWIENMASHFEKEKSIILGYGGYQKDKTSLLNKLVRFETLFTALQYFSYAKWGIPYMGVGRNLAYTSTEFYNQNGFATHLHVKSGDDDLFVNQAATASNTAICYHKEAITRSVPETNLRSWISQKRRHVSTAILYQKKHRILLATFFLSQFGFWVLFLALISLQLFWQVALVIVALRLLLQYTVFWRAAQKLDERDIVWLVPFLDIFLVFMQFGIFSTNLISKPANWK